MCFSLQLSWHFRVISRKLMTCHSSATLTLSWLTQAITVSFLTQSQLWAMQFSGEWHVNLRGLQSVHAWWLPAIRGTLYKPDATLDESGTSFQSCWHCLLRLVFCEYILPYDYLESLIQPILFVVVIFVSLLNHWLLNKITEREGEREKREREEREGERETRGRENQRIGSEQWLTEGWSTMLWILRHRCRDVSKRKRESSQSARIILGVRQPAIVVDWIVSERLHVPGSVSTGNHRRIIQRCSWSDFQRVELVSRLGSTPAEWLRSSLVFSPSPTSQSSESGSQKPQLWIVIQRWTRRSEFSTRRAHLLDLDLLLPSDYDQVLSVSPSPTNQSSESGSQQPQLWIVNQRNSWIKFQRADLAPPARIHSCWVTSIKYCLQSVSNNPARRTRFQHAPVSDLLQDGTTTPDITNRISSTLGMEATSQQRTKFIRIQQ